MDLSAFAYWLAERRIPFIRDAMLRDWTTFRLGGRCPLLVQAAAPETVAAVVAELAGRRLPHRVIGWGSNLLVADGGLPEVVVRFVDEGAAVVPNGGAIRVGGGMGFDDLAAWSCRVGVAGFVNASGIPGTVGGAICGNAGAFGWQMADCLVAAELIDGGGRRRTASREELGFAYRDSVLKRTGETVLRATFSAESADPAALVAERERILALRAAKHPDVAVTACAGSFFRNIEPTSAAARRQAAGWFLERVGAKTMRVGGAGVFPKHANIPVKIDDSCTAADVMALTGMMAEAVRERFGLELVREVQWLEG